MVAASQKLKSKPAKHAALQRVLLAAAEIWQPKPKPTTVEWVIEKVRLPSATSANPGPFDIAGRPYMRDVLAAMDDPDIYNITIMGDAQGGKTVAIISMLLSRMEIDTAPCMMVGPDQTSMRELRNKIYDYCQASPALANCIPPENEWNEREMVFNSMVCYLAYSGSKQTLRTRTTKYVFCTETDVWADDVLTGDPLVVARARTKAWDEFKFVCESTPTDDHSRIAREYYDGDQRRWYCPCPNCGHYQELRLFPHSDGQHAGRGGLRGYTKDNGEPHAENDLADHVYYECINCDVPIKQHHKQTMVERGAWCPMGCTVDLHGQVRGTPDKEKTNASFHIWAILNPTVTLAQLAAEYLKHRAKRLLKIFYNNWLGLPHRTQAKMPEHKALGQRLKTNAFARGQVPADCYFLTAGVDVQGDRLYFVVRGWGLHQNCYTIDWGCIRPEQLIDPGLLDKSQSLAIERDLVQLWPILLNREYPVRGYSPFGSDSMRIRLIGVDANYRTRQVQQFLRHASAGTDRIRAVRGDSSVHSQQLFRRTLVETNTRTGEKYDGGLELWGIAVNHYKENEIQVYQRTPPEHGALALPGDILQSAGGEDYLRQIVNEAPKTKQKDGERDKLVWSVIDAGVGNHYWDASIYTRALADMVTGGDWDLHRFVDDSRHDVAHRAQHQHDIQRGRAAL
jgi:phage terminase large subunit GpA-like protein